MRERRKEYEVTNTKENDFERAGGGEIIRVGNRNKAKKRRK